MTGPVSDVISAIETGDADVVTGDQEESNCSDDQDDNDPFAGHFMEELLALADHSKDIPFKVLLQHWIACCGIKKSHVTVLMRLLRHYRPDIDYETLPATGQQIMHIDADDFKTFGMEIAFTNDDYDSENGI